MALIDPFDLIKRKKISGPTKSEAERLGLPLTFTKKTKQAAKSTKKEAPKTGLIGKMIPYKDEVPRTPLKNQFGQPVSKAPEQIAPKARQFLTQALVGDTVRFGVGTLSKPKTLTEILKGNIPGAIRTGLKEEPIPINIQPKGKTQEYIFGKEPITDIKESPTVKKTSELLAQFTPLSEKASGRLVQTGALPLFALLSEPGLSGLGKKVGKEVLEEGIKKLGKEVTERIIKEEGEVGLRKAIQEGYKYTTPIRRVESSIPEITSKMNPENPKIKGLIKSYQEGKSVPDIPVFEKDGKFLTNKDGEHRLFAAKQAGIEDINVKVEPKTDLTGYAKQKLERGLQDPLIQEAKVAKNELVDKAGNIRLDKIKAPDDVINVIKQTAKQFEQPIDEARRGVIKQAETKKMAEDLGMSLEELKERKIGQAMNAEEIQAATRIMRGTAEKVSKAEAKYSSELTDVALSEYMQALNDHALVQASVAGMKAEAGRALAIQKVIIDKSKEPVQKLHEAVIGMYGGSRRSKQFVDTLLKSKKAAEQSGDFRGYYKMIRNANKATTLDKVYEFWLNSILSGIKTHVVNTVSNVVMAGKLVGEKGLQAVAELPRGANRDVTFREVGDYAMGAIHGLSDGVTRALRVMKYGTTPEMATKLDINRLPAIGGITGEIVRAPTRALSAEDEFFKAISGTAETYAQAYRLARKEGVKGKKMTERVAELIENPTEEMMANVKKTELEATFQTQLGSIGKWITEGRNKVDGLKYVIPFVRTPTNIFKEALRTSPLSFLEAANLARKGAPTEQVTKAVAKGMMGSIIGAGVVLGTLNGKITGPAPRDAGERDQFYGEGKKPIAIKIGDKWVSLQRIEPLATVMSAVSDVTNAVKDRRDTTSAMLSFIPIMAASMQDKTFMKGISDVMSIANGHGTEGEMTSQFKRAVISMMVGFEPQLIGGVAKAFDPIVRETKDDEWWGQVIKTLKAKTPFLSQSVPAKMDVFGEEIKKEEGFLGRLLSPIERGTETKDPVRLEMNRLGIDFGFPARTKTIAGIEKVPQGKTEHTPKLSGDTYQGYIKATGQLGHARILQLINDPTYQLLPDQSKLELMEDLMTDTRRQVTQNKVGQLLLDISGVDYPKSTEALTILNMIYSQFTQSKEWQNMEDDIKLRTLLEDYTSLLTQYPNG